MTTPSTVSARAQLVRAHGVERHDDDFADEPVRECWRRFHSRLKRFDRIQPRRPHRRIQAEEQPDQRGDADAERDRPELERRPESA